MCQLKTDIKIKTRTTMVEMFAPECEPPDWTLTLM